MSLPLFNEMASVEDTLIFFFKIFSIEVFFFFFFTVVVKGILDDTEPAVPTKYLDIPILLGPYFVRIVLSSLKGAEIFWHYGILNVYLIAIL